MYCTDTNEFHVTEHVTAGSLSVNDSPWQENLQAAVNKMVYTNKQCVFCVQKFYQTDNIIIMQHVFQMRFDSMKVSV
jgi:hypothetical protein